MKITEQFPTFEHYMAEMLDPVHHKDEVFNEKFNQLHKPEFSKLPWPFNSMDPVLVLLTVYPGMYKKMVENFENPNPEWVEMDDHFWLRDEVTVLAAQWQAAGGTVPDNFLS